MNSYLTAVVLLIVAAIQADAFTGSMPLTGVRSSASQRGAVFKMELSPYEEYMASRGGKVSTPAAPAVSAPSAPARVSSPTSTRSSSATSGGKWQPRDKPSWKSSPSSARGGVSSPAVSSPAVSSPVVSSPKVSSPSAPAAYTPPAPAPSAPAPAPQSSVTGAGHVGSGGMADTRDPTPQDHEDPRKSISAAPSFEEYLKSRG